LVIDHSGVCCDAILHAIEHYINHLCSGVDHRALIHPPGSTTMDTDQRLREATLSPHATHDWVSAIESYNQVIDHAAQMVEDGVLTFDEAQWLVSAH